MIYSTFFRSFVRPFEMMIIVLLVYSYDSFYRQNRGKTNKSGSKIGTIIRDAPHVHALPTIAVMMMQKIVKLTT